MRTDTQLIDALEAEAERGSSPALINDDNGHWAVTEEGMQSVPMGDGPATIQTMFIVEADKWKNSVREAINAYLDEYLEE